MPTPQKEAIIQEMTEKFSNASSIFVADFTGIDVNMITELRRGFREAKVEYRVVKKYPGENVSEKCRHRQPE
jgi:large subunit ribosomal protein L10